MSTFSFKGWTTNMVEMTTSMLIVDLIKQKCIKEKHGSRIVVNEEVVTYNEVDISQFNEVNPQQELVKWCEKMGESVGELVAGSVRVLETSESFFNPMMSKRKVRAVYRVYETINDKDCLYCELKELVNGSKKDDKDGTQSTPAGSSDRSSGTV